MFFRAFVVGIVYHNVLHFGRQQWHDAFVRQFHGHLAVGGIPHLVARKHKVNAFRLEAETRNARRLLEAHSSAVELVDSPIERTQQRFLVAYDVVECEHIALQAVVNSIFTHIGFRSSTSALMDAQLKLNKAVGSEVNLQHMARAEGVPRGHIARQ